MLGVVAVLHGSFSWDGAIHLADVLNFATTVVIAVFVAEFVRHRAEASKAERDLLIKYLADAEEEAQAIRSVFVKTLRGDALTVSESNDVLTRFRQINNLLYLVQRVGERSELEYVKRIIGGLKFKVMDYKAVVTGGERPTFPTGEPYRNRHDVAFRDLLEEFSFAACEINKG